MSKSVKLSEYSEKTQGIGVLATTDASGQVNQAIYGRPHFLDEDDNGTCSFIMSNRLSHDNVRHNPSAAYLFVEERQGLHRQAFDISCWRRPFPLFCPCGVLA